MKQFQLPKKGLFLLAATLLSISAIAQRINALEQEKVQEGYAKYGRLLFYIANSYVDTANIAKLVDKAVIATLQELDPHSTYISADEVKAMNEPLEGNFEGIGVEFNIQNDTLTVVTPVAGGPSEMVGVRAGDRIVEIDGKKITNINLKNDQVFKMLRGPKGTKVSIAVMRKGSQELLRFEIVRDKIPIHSVDAAYEPKPGVGYIRLSRFAISSVEEIQQAYANLPNQPKALILDLRGNGGGVLKAAIDLSDQFFSEGRLLVYTEGTHWRKQMELSTNSGFYKEGKLVILIDEGSASASEIVSGAVQDWDRGIIIGRRSFGKGLVQQSMPMPDGSQIRLTVARYHTPTGRVIQRPYDAGKVDKYYADLYKRFTDGEIYHQENIVFPDSLKYKTLKNERTVYGGGGIMPDIFVAHDTSAYSEYYAKLSRMDILRQFAHQYMDANRDKLKKQYATFAAFNKNFQISEKLFNELVVYAEKQNLPKDEAAIAKSGEDIKMVLKAVIARILWGTSEYFQVVNSHGDNAYSKALEVIDNWAKYEKEVLGEK